MNHAPGRSLQAAFSIVSLPCFVLLVCFGETAYARDRVRSVIDGRTTVEKPGNRHPSARAEFAIGDVPPDSHLERMVLVLSGDAEQERALEALLDDQQNPSSAEYQRWLSP